MSVAAPLRNDEDNDMCPICKSSRYLNPSMKFLVNPECYHKMCESCVDRIFSLGPSPCPYAGCGKILRKNKFKQQLFEDLGVEKEVDVRRRVAKTFNKRQDDFDTLQDYNDYLEEVERIVFNLTEGVDKEATEAKLLAYEQANRTTILANSMRQKQDDEQVELRAKMESERRKQQQQLARQMAMEEEQIRTEARAELLRELATSKGDADAITRKINNSVLKRSSARRKELESQFAQQSSAFEFLSRGKREESEGLVSPFTPFVGDRQLKHSFIQKEEYYDPSMEAIAKDLQYVGSGFRVDVAIRHSLTQAFFGLGCNIQEEKSKQEDQIQSTEVEAVA